MKKTSFFLVVFSLIFIMLSMSVAMATSSNNIIRVQGPVFSGLYSGSAVSAVLNSVPTQGDLLIAVVGIDSESIKQQYTVSTINQTGVTWSYQTSSTFNEGGKEFSMNAFGDVEIWAGVVGSGAGKTVTASFNGFTNYGIVLDVAEYSGLATSGFLDQTATNSTDSVGVSASPNTGTTAMTNQANELCIGGIAAVYVTQYTPTTNGFTLFDGTKTAECSYGYLEKIVNCTGQENAGDTAGYVHWTGCIATFFAGAAIPITTPTLIATSNITTSSSPLLEFGIIAAIAFLVISTGLFYRVGRKT